MVAKPMALYWPTSSYVHKGDIAKVPENCSSVLLIEWKQLWNQTSGKDKYLYFFFLWVIKKTCKPVQTNCAIIIFLYWVSPRCQSCYMSLLTLTFETQVSTVACVIENYLQMVQWFNLRALYKVVKSSFV